MQEFKTILVKPVGRNNVDIEHFKAQRKNILSMANDSSETNVAYFSFHLVYNFLSNVSLSTQLLLW